MEKPKSSEPFGRSAALVHGLALTAFVAALISFLFVNPVEPEGRQFAFVFGGMVLATAVALASWSIILATRSILRQEDSAWAGSVFYLTLAEGLFAILNYFQ